MPLMPFGDAIQALRDGARSELNAGHDYYTDTKIAMEIARGVIGAGHTFSNRNTITGTITTQDDLLRRAQRYISEQLAEATFQQFISIFENYFFDLLRLWLNAYPQSLIGKRVDFKAILDAPDKEAITRLVVDKELNEILYERPASWFEYLEEKVKLGCPARDEIERIAEAKASRDVLVHNRRLASKTYESKSGKIARFKAGQIVDISEQYHRETWELLQKVIGDISNAAIAKVS